MCRSSGFFSLFHYARNHRERRTVKPISNRPTDRRRGDINKRSTSDLRYAGTAYAWAEEIKSRYLRFGKSTEQGKPREKSTGPLRWWTKTPEQFRIGVLSPKNVSYVTSSVKRIQNVKRNTTRLCGPLFLFPNTYSSQVLFLGETLEDAREGIKT